MSNYELVCKVCDSGISVSEGSKDFAKYNEYVNEGLDWFNWCGNCQKETKQKIEEFSPLSKRLRRIKKNITELLKYHNLKTSDLSVKFQDWEARLDRIDTEEEIKDFQIEIQTEIQKQKNNGLSLPVKLLIGWGVVAILIVLYLKKQRGKAKTVN